MESILTLLLPALAALLLCRVLLTPVKWGIHAGLGFLCLWLLNTVSGITGLYLPINAVTVLLASFFGMPGIGLVALLAVL